jgi:hypothetical protein
MSVLAGNAKQYSHHVELLEAYLFIIPFRQLDPFTLVSALSPSSLCHKQILADITGNI